MICNALFQVPLLAKVTVFFVAKVTVFFVFFCCTGNMVESELNLVVDFAARFMTVVVPLDISVDSTM